MLDELTISRHAHHADKHAMKSLVRQLEKASKDKRWLSPEQFMKAMTGG